MVQQKGTRRSILDARNAEMRQCEYGGHFSWRAKGIYEWVEGSIPEYRKAILSIELWRGSPDSNDIEEA